MKKVLETEIQIASIRVFEKDNEDGSIYRANIIDGLLMGVGIISQFVPVTNITGIIQENSMYPCEVFLKTTRGKAGIELKIKGE